MYNVFNMGIGMVIIADPNNANQIIDELDKFEYSPRVIGRVVNKPGVKIKWLKGLRYLHLEQEAILMQL